MSLVLRLRQQGRKNRRTFRMVITDIRNPRDGKYIESVGHYNAHEEDSCVVNKERVEFWLAQGVKPSERMISILKRKCPETLAVLKK